jgi:hypothetical protein
MLRAGYRGRRLAVNVDGFIRLRRSRVVCHERDDRPLPAEQSHSHFGDRPDRRLTGREHDPLVIGGTVAEAAQYAPGKREIRRAGIDDDRMALDVVTGRGDHVDVDVNDPHARHSRSAASRVNVDRWIHLEATGAHARPPASAMVS